MQAALGDLSRYAIASAFSFVFVLACTAGFHELIGLSETLSPALALLAAFIVNFTLLRTWVFPGQTASLRRQVTETAIASVSFRAAEYAVFLGLHLGLDVNYLIATGASLCLSAAGKFAVYREVVFNRARGSVAASAEGSRWEGATPASSSSRRTRS
jgi:putative flippase GtrA